MLFAGSRNYLHDVLLDERFAGLCAGHLAMSTLDVEERSRKLHLRVASTGSRPAHDDFLQGSRVGYAWISHRAWRASKDCGTVHLPRQSNRPSQESDFEGIPHLVAFAHKMLWMQAEGIDEASTCVIRSRCPPDRLSHAHPVLAGAVKRVSEGAGLGRQ